MTFENIPNDVLDCLYSVHKIKSFIGKMVLRKGEWKQNFLQFKGYRFAHVY